MSRYFNEAINEKQLAEKIFNAIITSVPSYVTDEEHVRHLMQREDIKDNDYQAAVQNHWIGEYALHIPSVEKDLTKVEFDTENFHAHPDDWDNTGLSTLNNGLTYLGIVAGGDWENPLYMIIYWDGKRLRGYIPKEGNPWNTDTKAAYGNDEDCDDKNAMKRFGCKYDNTEIDMNKIIQDIQKRVTKKE